MLNPGGVRIARVFGIDLRVDVSWLFVLVLLTWNLSHVFRGWHPAWASWVVVAVALAAALAFFASVVLHEFAHSLVALAYGIRVRRIVLFMLGGVSDIEREPPSPSAELLIAAVGPLTSVALGVVAFATGSIITGARGIDDIAHAGPIATLLMWLGPANVLVGVFNLLPAFPLDGGRILRATIWAATGNSTRATRWASLSGLVLGLGAVAFGGLALLRGDAVGGLWTAFIGWFITSAALRARARAELDEALAGVPVSRIMRQHGATVASDLPVSALAAAFLETGQRAFPVLDDAGRFRGMVGVEDAQRVPERAWATVPIEQVLRTTPEVSSTTPWEPVSEALVRMMSAGTDHLPVLHDGRLVGVLTREEIERWLELHMRPAPMRPSHA